MDEIAEMENQTPNPTSFHSINIDDASLKYALANLKNNKATGVDSIPAEVFLMGAKHCMPYSYNSLTESNF